MAVLGGQLQRNPTDLVNYQHETYDPASCPECGAKWYRVRGGMVLLHKRNAPKRALTAKRVGTRRTSD